MIRRHSVHRHGWLSILVATMLAAALCAPGALAAERLTVVELFTSQGCSSCPPANDNLVRLSNRSDVLSLSFAVTYWDYLGWKDTFGKPEFTDRQVAYEPGLGHRSPFTPQMVVNGRLDTIGNRLSEVEALIDKAGAIEGPAIDIRDGSVVVASAPRPSKTADVWLVHYDPRTVEVPVGRGENTGRTLPHAGVVHKLTRIGSWNGDSVEMPISPAASELSVAVLVQLPGGGPILAAARRQTP